MLSATPLVLCVEVMKTIIIDYRVDTKSIKKLTDIGFNVIKTIPVKKLYEAVNGHPDMQLHCIDKNTIICAKEVYEYYKEQLPESYNLICGKTGLKDKYPYDILYNAAVIGSFVICNEKYTADEILEAHRRDGRKIINVKQGYAKCSTAVVNECAAITADEGIYKALTENNIDALKINPGSIKLETMSYGFIGGCCGLIDNKTLAFNGDINKHQHGKLIIDFCISQGINVLCLNNKELYDIGTIMCI